MKRLATLLVALSMVLAGVAVAEGVMLYGTTDVGDALYRINTADGSYTLVGNYTLNSPGTELFIGGLVYDSGVDLFYGISASTVARLYTVSPINAATTDIGAVGVGFIFEGGLAFDPTDGTLYGVNQGSDTNPNLLTLNTSTGAGTVVGLIGGGSHDFGGLAFDAGGQLYGLDRVTNALWKIDKSNPSGSGTAQVGSGLGGTISMGVAGGMATDSSGVVYGYGEGSNELFTVSLALGTGTVIHSYLAGDPVFYSLGFSTSGSPVEPTSWGRIKATFAE
jgi:DNA-binding beta-propeller fold protein YncE